MCLFPILKNEFNGCNCYGHLSFAMNPNEMRLNDQYPGAKFGKGLLASVDIPKNTIETSL
jgi:hypothetical protein